MQVENAAVDLALVGLRLDLFLEKFEFEVVLIVLALYGLMGERTTNSLGGLPPRRYSVSSMSLICAI